MSRLIAFLTPGMQGGVEDVLRIVERFRKCGPIALPFQGGLRMRILSLSVYVGICSILWFVRLAQSSVQSLLA